MTVQSWSNRWLNRLYKSLAILLVLIAVIMSGLRLLLPYADNYRQDLQNYINQMYRSDIRIGQLTTGWHRFGPTLVAKNVSLLETDAVKIFIEVIDIKVDFWGSIKEQRLKTTDFTLVGVKAKLDKTLLTQQNEQKETAPDFAGLSELFLQQVERFSVKNSQMFVQDFHDQHRRFLIKQLAWLNQGNRHKAIGDVEVDGVTKNTLKMMMDLTGDRVSNLDGQLYLSGESINITPWLGRFTNLDMRHVSTDINFQSWLRIDDGNPVNIDLQLGKNTISWQVDDDKHQLTLPSGQLQWQHNPLTQQTYLRSGALKVSYDEVQWPEFVLQGYKDPSTQNAYISQLELSQIAQLYPLAETDSHKLNWFNALGLGGKIQDLHIKQVQNDTVLTGKFEQVSWSYLDGIAGVSDLSGQFTANSSQAVVKVSGENGFIDFDHHFSQPMPYEFLSATNRIKWRDNTWQLNASDIALVSDELMLDGELTLSKVEQQPVFMALLAHVRAGDAASAGHYFPLQIMDKSLVNYLNQAIIDGTVANATVAINGPVDKFPFGDGEGMFIVDADLTNATFAFSPQWPAIKDFNANLNFTNKTMTITGNSGYLRDLDVNGVVASISDLTSDPILQVTAKIQNHPRAISDLMQASPLSSSVGEVLKNIIVSGEVSADFSLTVPLDDPDETLAQGKIYLSDNDVDLTTPSMAFTDVSGEVNFANAKISSDNLQFNWLGMPTQVKVNANQKNHQFVTTLEIDANWPKSVWPQTLSAKLKNYAQGSLDWTGKLTLNHEQDGDFDYNFSLKSDLTQLALLLPAPFNKDVAEQRTFSVTANGSSESSAINASLSNQLNFYGELNHENVHFERAHLVLGQEQMFLPVSGFHISVDLAQVEFSPWFDFVKDITSLATSDKTAAANKNVLDSPARVRGVVKEVSLFEQSLNQVSFDLQNLSNWWQLEVNAEQARVQAKFYHDWQNLGAEIDADFVKLGDANPKPKLAEVPTTEVKPPEPVMDSAQALAMISDTVPIKVRCKSCQYHQLQLGEVSFELEKSGDDTLLFRNFSTRRNGLDLVLNGKWQANDNTHFTQVNGSLKVKDIEHELGLMGYDSIIRDSGANVELDLNWPGAPIDFALARLNGEVDSRLDDGYLADVSDKGVRLLSVLSLRSLVRKLTLDFRDIFSKGMFYDEIKGQLTLQDGVLYTKNIEMDGTAGDLSMQGNTDLVSGKLDYRMSFVPKVTSSIPVIIAWMTANPVIGLAALAVDGVLQSAEVISKINYELTGTVNEPVFKQVDRKSRVITVAPTKVAEKTEGLDPTIPQLNQPKVDKQNNPEKQQWQ